jgi:hypothetical protein
MLCPYCEIYIYNEKDMKLHIEFSHHGQPEWELWVKRDLSEYFS